MPSNKDQPKEIDSEFVAKASEELVKLSVKKK